MPMHGIFTQNASHHILTALGIAGFIVCITDNVCTPVRVHNLPQYAEKGGSKGSSFLSSFFSNEPLILVNRYVDSKNLKRGDRVVVCDPYNPGRHLLLRIKGVPGGDPVFIFLRHPITGLVWGTRGITIERGRCWVEEDKALSQVDKGDISTTGSKEPYDSRVFGQIPLALIVGCPVGILWPRFASLPTNEEATVSNQESADASSNG